MDCVNQHFLWKASRNVTIAVIVWSDLELVYLVYQPSIFDYRLRIYRWLSRWDKVNDRRITIYCSKNKHEPWILRQLEFFFIPGYTRTNLRSPLFQWQTKFHLIYSSSFAFLNSEWFSPLILALTQIKWSSGKIAPYIRTYFALIDCNDLRSTAQVSNVYFRAWYRRCTWCVSHLTI